MIKDILVNLAVEGERDVAAAYGIELAQAFDAHVTAVALAAEPIIAAVPIEMPSWELIDAQRTENEARARAAKERFEEAAQRAGISFGAALCQLGTGSAAQHFGMLARASDVSVVVQPRSQRGPIDDLVLEAALFRSGRPTLVVPYVHAAPFKLDRAMICWDGGVSAARAIADAIPLLLRTRQVELVTVIEEEGQRDLVPGAEMAHHLARHELKLETRRIVARQDVQATILSHAADMGADLLVMGGYGHSRWRELVLGGVTRAMIGSMTVPCLMSH